MVWYPLLIVYALCLTLLFLLKNFRLQKDSLIGQLREAAKNEDLSALEHFNSLCEIAKIQQNQIPWYERSVSTIGIVAFISMLIATGIQTISATHESLKVDFLKVEVEKLIKQKNEAETLVADISNAIFSIHLKSGKLDAAEAAILRYRMNQLENVSKLDEKVLIEQYRISLILGDFDKAIGILDQNIKLLDETSDIDQVSLAEYYYLTGGHEKAKELLSMLLPRLSILSDQLKFRIVVLSALSDPDIKTKTDNYVRQIASLLKMNFTEAEIRLEREMKIFTDASIRIGTKP